MKRLKMTSVVLNDTLLIVANGIILHAVFSFVEMARYISPKPETRIIHPIRKVGQQRARGGRSDNPM